MLYWSCKDLKLYSGVWGFLMLDWAQVCSSARCSAGMRMLGTFWHNCKDSVYTASVVFVSCIFPFVWEIDIFGIGSLALWQQPVVSLVLVPIACYSIRRAQLSGLGLSAQPGRPQEIVSLSPAAFGRRQKIGAAPQSAQPAKRISYSWHANSQFISRGDRIQVQPVWNVCGILQNQANGLEVESAHQDWTVAMSFKLLYRPVLPMVYVVHRANRPALKYSQYIGWTFLVDGVR